MKKCNLVTGLLVVLTVVLFISSAHANPKNGVWYNKGQPGSGMFIDIQDSYLAIGWFAYDAATGEPVWYMSDGPMSSATTYTGNMWKFLNGQPIGGPYSPPNQTTIGTISINFHSDSSGTVACPMGTVEVERQVRENTNPAPPVNEQKAKTELLKGHWWMTIFMLTTFYDDIDLWQLNQDSEGHWYLGGVNEYGNLAVGGYISDQGVWSIYVANDFLFDDMYIFQTDGNTISDGTYYLAYHDGTFSNAYTLTGYKTRTLQFLSAPLIDEGQEVQKKLLEDENGKTNKSEKLSIIRGKMKSLIAPQ